MLYSSDRDTDMLPEWEKEKLKAQNRSNNENLNGDDTRKTQNATPVPVVKDASEFRELTQVSIHDFFEFSDFTRIFLFLTRHVPYVDNLV